MKNTFIKSTIILTIGTLLTKLLGFFIKIIFTRLIGTKGISLYSIVMPTYSLLIAITQLGLPYAISIIVSRKSYKSINVITSIIPIAIVFNILIIFLVINLAPYLSNNLLHNPDAYYPIISICFVTPFTTISGIIKGYFFGKQNMTPNAISSIFEQLARLIILITIIPLLLRISIIHAVSGYIIASSICELIQILVYMLFIPKHTNINIKKIKINFNIVNDILSISIPTVGSRIIGNISYFLEPIILTNISMFVGYSNNFILTEYGIYNAYVIPLLTTPSFLLMCINTTLIPEISKNYKNHKVVNKYLIKTIIFSLSIGLIFSLFIYFFGPLLLNIIYNTNEGINYIKILNIIFPLYYLEGPAAAILIGLNQTKYTFFVTTISCIIKIISLILFSLLSIGLYSLIISEIINIFVVVYLDIKKLRLLGYLKLKKEDY